MSEWAAEVGLILLNLKQSPTTYHPRGTSTIDLSWANQKAFESILGWRVNYEEDSHSDHFNILLNVKTKSTAKKRAKLMNTIFPR